MSTPPISIIIPVRNGSKTIKKCLEHIFNQTYKNFEVIIVNDGSTDDTLEKINHFVSVRNVSCAFVFSQPNSGAPAARNRGFKESKGEHLLFVDADVYLKPDCLKIMFETLQNHPEAAYAYSSFRWDWKKFKLWKFDAEKLKQMPYINTSSLIRRECFPASGWDESLKRFQDWDLWLTMLEGGHQGVWIPEVLFATSTKSNTISQWTPAFIYNHLPWLDKNKVKKYNEAKEIILNKHHLK